MSLWCIQPFYGEYTDLIILIINVLVSFLCYKVLKKNHIYEASNYIKLMLIIDLIMLIIFIDMAERTTFLLVVISVLYIIKFIVDVLFYSEFLEDKKNWIIFNGLIVFLFIIQYKTRALVTILLFSSLMLCIRFIYQMKIINKYNKYLGSEYTASEIDDSRVNRPMKRRVCKYMLLVAFALILSFFRFVFIEHASSREYVSDNVYQYEKRNLIPEWTGFTRSKYGLYDVETGFDTSAIYDNRLLFDNQNRAWDYNGHFIDEHGDIVIDTPFLVSAKISERQKYIYSAFITLVDKDVNSADKLYWLDEEPFERIDFNNLYFKNGVGYFRCRIFGTLGLMDEDGKIIAFPKYERIIPDHSFQEFRCVLPNSVDEEVVRINQE